MSPQTPPMPIRISPLLALTFAISACGVADTAEREDTRDDTDSASLYALTSVWRDQTGRTLHLADLGDRVHLVAMVYTSCTLTCPQIVGELQRIEAAVPTTERGALGIVLVSLDPDRDTSERLAEYARTTKLDPARWTLLNGNDADVRELAAVLNVRYQPQPDGEIAHTNGIAVLDRRGVVVHYQPTLGAPVAETIALVQRLVQ
jgi:protein SCO1/2